MFEMLLASSCSNQCLNEDVIHLLGYGSAAAEITWPRKSLYLTSLRNTPLYEGRKGRIEELENRLGRYLQGARAGRPLEGAE